MFIIRLAPRIFSFLAVLVLLAGMLACASSGLSPAPVPMAAATMSSGVVQPQPTEGDQVASAMIPETRRLTLEFPPKIRAGVESEIIILTLAVEALGNMTPTAQFEGNTVTGDVVTIPNLYETHNVTVEARMDLAGMEISPSGAIFEPLKPGQSVTFYWSIRPQETGTYRGTIWLHLNFADKVSGEESRIPVSAQIIEIEAVDFFGLSVNVARTSGVVGSIVGGVIGFPFLEDIIKFIFKKRKNIS